VVLHSVGLLLLSAMSTRILLICGALASAVCTSIQKEDLRKEFWGDLIFHSNVQADTFVSPSGNRRLSEQAVPQVLMTKCPLNSRCVRRNFCDGSGLMTTNRNNKLTFSTDDRGLIACVDAVRNRLGVCCIDRFKVLAGRRLVRQDDTLKVADDGLVTLDTLPAALDTSLTDIEEEIFEEEFSILDKINENPVLNSEEPDTIKDINSVLEEDIESILEKVKEVEGKAPVIMVTDEEDEDENISVRFLQPGQVAGVEGGPIVVINIHADSLGLGGRDGDLDLAEIRDKIRENSKSKQVLREESIPVTLDENITEDDEEEEEIEDDINTPDYLDFDTDYITITMERDYPDFSSYYNGNNYRRQHVRRPYSSRANRPHSRRRPGRPRRPVFRFRTNQN